MRRSLSMSAAPAAAHQHEHAEGYEVLAARTAHKPGFRRKTWLLRGIGLCVLLGGFLATSFTLGRKDNLHKVLLWVHEHTVAGLVIFGLLYVWFTVMFLPPALLAACAGALYGLLKAIPVVWVCAVVGETVSFLLGRFLLRKWVAELTADWPMWAALNAALREDGWKLVLLLRMSPAMPFSVINYALGSSSLPFGHYFWPSVVGIIPGLIIYVWLGSLAADVTEAVAGGGMSTPPAAKIAVIVICAVSALIVVVLSAVYTKRAIDKRLASVHVEETVQVQEQHTFLLGGRSSTASHDDEEAAAGSAHGNGVSTGGQAPAGEGGVRHGVMISVETPMLVVRSRSSSSEPGSKQQPLRTLGANPAGSQLGWGARVASRLGLGAAGSSGSTRKLKVTDDFDSDMMAPLHPQHQPGVMGDGAGSSTSTSSSVKPCCKNRNGH